MEANNEPFGAGATGRASGLGPRIGAPERDLLVWWSAAGSSRGAEVWLMCGRFVQSAEPETYAELFDVDRIVADRLPPSYNVAPTDPVYAVAEHDGERLLGSFRWGLIPFWAKDRRIAAKNINARSETAATKSTFRESFAKRRCLIPAEGFYEWQPRPKGKLPHYVYGVEQPLALAGLWATWRDPETDERVRSCSILTGAPNAKVRSIHDRMPVILPATAWSMWLDRDMQDPARAQALLRPADPEIMDVHPVSTLVNKVANNVPELIEPLTTGAVDQELG